MNTPTLLTLYLLFSATILSFLSGLGYLQGTQISTPIGYPIWVPNVFNRPSET